MLMVQQCAGQRGQRPAQAEIALGNKGLQWTPMKMPRFLHTSRRRSMQAARLSLHACIAEGVYYLH